jgi:hypothetical protein
VQLKASYRPGDFRPLGRTEPLPRASSEDPTTGNADATIWETERPHVDTVGDVAPRCHSPPHLAVARGDKKRGGRNHDRGSRVHR